MINYMTMKRVLLFGICLLFAMSACEDKDKLVYRPSKFPDAKEKRDMSFAIPYMDKNRAMVVRARLNSGPQFSCIWDSGCSVPLKISALEAAQLIKDGTLSSRDYITSYPVTVANGQSNEYDVYLLKSVSFADNKGNEHTLTDVPAVIDDNVGTDILIGLPVMQSLGYAHEISQLENLIIFKE